MTKIPPKLNLARRFSDNMTTAHSLTLKAKNGEKGNSKGERYALPAFNVTTFQGINAAFTAFELLGSSGLLAFSNSALKHFGDGDPVFGLEIATVYVEKKAKKATVKVATHLDHGDYTSEGGRKVVQASVQMLTSVMADNSTDKVTKTAQNRPLAFSAAAGRWCMLQNAICHAGKRQALQQDGSCATECCQEQPFAAKKH